MRTTLACLFAILAIPACTPEVAPPAVPPASPVAAPAVPPAAPPLPVATTPDEPFRAHKPAPLATEPPFAAPVPVQRRLLNGAEVLVVENHALPLVAVEIAVESAVDREPLNRRGLSGFVAEMLLEGTQSRSGTEIEIARERLGAQLSAGNDLETSTLHLNALKETLPDALALLADVLMHPAFKPDDFERMRGSRLTYLASKKGMLDALASDDFNRLLWGAENPWGLPGGGTPETVKAITLKDLARFHATYYVPNNAVISVSGDVTPDEAVAALEKALGTWKKSPLPPRKPVRLPEARARSIVFTDLPTATQSQVWVGWRAPRANDPAILPLMIAEIALGGLFSSRLNMNIREQKGFSYGVFSNLHRYRDVSVLVAQGGIVAEHTAEAVTEYEKELSRMSTDPLSDEELARAKEALIRGLPSQLETNDDVASSVARLVERDLPLDYFATLAARVRAVQKEDILAAVKKVIHPDRWPVVVVGPRTKSLDALKALGIGEVNEVTPE